MAASASANTRPPLDKAAPTREDAPVQKKLIFDGVSPDPGQSLSRGRGGSGGGGCAASAPGSRCARGRRPHRHRLETLPCRGVDQMRSRFVRRTSSAASSFAALTVSCLAILGAAGAAASGAQSPADELLATDEVTLPPPDQGGRVQVLVELAEPPAAVVYGAALHDGAVSRAQALANAVAAGKAQVARILPAQTRVAAAIAALPVNAAEIFRVQKAYNGISYYVDAAGMEALRQVAGVRAVHVVQPEYPSNFTSVPFVGAPQLWGNTLGLPNDITGTGVKIGIIDTGIDYQHPMFGGTGLQADYTANDRVTITPALFPTAKVVGGTDFAGDAYTGANSPAPDP